jgi:hypothetical protein
MEMLTMRLITVLVLGLMLSACGVIPSDKYDKYTMSSRAYEKALRWGDFYSAYSFHKNEKPLTEKERARLKHIRVSEFEAIDNFIDPDEKNARQIIELKYYFEDYQLVKSVTFNLKWEYDEKQKRWFIISPFPELRSLVKTAP